MPISSENSQRKSVARKVKVRPLPDSLICKFGSVLVNEDWSFLSKEMTSTELVESFQNFTGNVIENIFPEKTVTISDRDKPYMTEDLKLLRRQRIRAYRKNGRSEKYLALLKSFESKMRTEAEKYHQKILCEVAEGKRNNTYSALRKLEFSNDHTTQSNKSNFTLPSHAEENLSPVQSAERLAEYFSQISQEFEPISLEKFPPRLKDKLLIGQTDPDKPVLEEWQVYEKLRKSKKPNSIIPGDLPVKLLKEFTPELSKPVTQIYNQITETAEYPRQWVVEYQLAIPKVYPPLSEDDTRNIASTAYLSKQHESFIGD